MQIMSRVIVGNEENTVAWCKNGQQSNKRLKTLPPNVSGRSRGFLDFNIDRIQWNVPSYTNLAARVIWWGESFEGASNIKIYASSRNCINYGICTTTHLFRKYLASSEAIEVQFTTISKGVKRQVGTAFITIPEELMATDDEDYLHPISYSNTHRIFSPSNTTMGVMKVAIKLVLFEDIEKGDPLSIKNEQRMSVKDYLNYKKDPFVPPQSACSSSKVWTFLRGREMSARDEKSTLRELCQFSPANSAIVAMDDELKWKLRDCYKRNRKDVEGIYNCHNPGRNEGGEPEKENSKDPPSSTPNGNSPAGGGSANGSSSCNGHKRDEEKKENGSIEDPLTTEKPLDPEDEYQGIFFVGGFRKSSSTAVPQSQGMPRFYAIAKSFDDSIIKTHLSDENSNINYLKIVPVKIEVSELEKMNKSSLSIELWARHCDNHGEDVKIGTVTVGLHQFYVAFRHEIVRHRLYDLSLPVTSIDGWAAVNNSNGQTIGELNVLVAMGTKRQIDYLVQSKQLKHRREEENSQPPSFPDRSQTASILSSFLDNLSQQIAASKARNGGSGDHQGGPKKGELRKTSDLLEILQQSLTKPPAVMTNLFPSRCASGLHTNGESKNEVMPAASSTPRDVPDSQEKEADFLRIYLEIQCAMHLPKIKSAGGGGGESSKSLSKRAAKKGKIPEVEIEPSCYATFEARMKDDSTEMTVSSVEGTVYSTHVVERSCSPAWDKGFTVEIPKDLLTNLEKFFIVKVWRKAADCSNMTPTPIEDVVIGFCTVDLTVLSAGLPEISGCYNIVYFDGKCNGQLMLTLKPLEAIQHKDVLDQVSSGSGSKTPDSPLLSMLDISMESDLSLSRALKRKFTELDEITQRLRARLHDVTSSDLVSSDDEFENDLNTSVDEVDEEPMKEQDVVDAVKVDFNWLGHLTELQRQCVQLDQQMKRDTQIGAGLVMEDPGAGPSSAGQNTLYTNGGVQLESLQTALKDAVLNDRPDTA